MLPSAVGVDRSLGFPCQGEVWRSSEAALELAHHPAFQAPASNAGHVVMGIRLIGAPVCLQRGKERSLSEEGVTQQVCACTHT